MPKLVFLLILLGLFAPTSMASPALGVSNQAFPTAPIAKTPQRPSFLVTLSTAQTLDDRFIGFAGTPSPLYRAFEQAQAAGSSLLPLLKDVFPKATPAGKIYIVRLIQQINSLEGHRRWKQLQADSSTVSTRSGCLIFSRQVRDIATEELQN